MDSSSWPPVVWVSRKELDRLLDPNNQECPDSKDDLDLLTPSPLRKGLTQFNWSRQWKKKVEPFLHHELVDDALFVGMSYYSLDWKSGDLPYYYGRPQGRRVAPGKLSSYRPWGLCHHIAFFSAAIGALNYPELDWRILSGDLHTVPVGFDRENQPRLVMDILLFDRMTAEESIFHTQKKLIHRTDPVVSAQYDVVTKIFMEQMPRLRSAGAALRMVKEAKKKIDPDAWGNMPQITGASKPAYRIILPYGIS